MTEDKEFESLDALFKKTFEEQANTNPAAQGWDTPSDKVWQHIQHQVKPPQSGWTMRTWTMILSMGAIVLLGLYLMLKKDPVQPIVPPAPVTPVQPAIVAATPATTQQPAATANVTETTQTPVVSRPKLSATVTTQAAKADNAKPQSAPPVASTHNAQNGLQSASVFAPNTTILREMEARKRAPWKRRPASLPNSPKDATAPILPDWMKGN
ncbi:MAG: hypothetical protein IT269_04035 [Saprospiraceae bacterium]|nr:hypothetical protein [Saprospiraceae bacterium]